METDDEEIGISIREQEQDTKQILFRSLIKPIPPEVIIEVWHVRATGTKGIGHYLILLEDGTHLCTCLLLINKGLLCRHFFRVGTYSRYAVFHISMIPNRWYLNPSIEINELLQQYSSVSICEIKLPEDDSTTLSKVVNFQHYFAIRNNSLGSYCLTKSTKAVYGELSGLSRKVIDCAIKAGMQQELSNLLKSFVYDVQNKVNNQESGDHLVNVKNPDIMKHKGRPLKRLK